jgi:hypothetical protein
VTKPAVVLDAGVIEQATTKRSFRVVLSALVGLGGT